MRAGDPHWIDVAAWQICQRHRRTQILLLPDDRTIGGVQRINYV